MFILPEECLKLRNETCRIKEGMLTHVERIVGGKGKEKEKGGIEVTAS